MAHTFTPQDAYALMGELVAQATGEKSITVFDTASFVSAGELVLSTGTENTLNALSIIMGRTFMAVRPYNARLNSINAINSGLFTDRIRKISFYSGKAMPSGNFNTDLYTNHAYGYDNGTNGATGSTPATNSTKDMFEQVPAIPLELNFLGRDVWQDGISVYEDQVQRALRDESSFISFVSAFMTQKANDIEMQKEAFNRMTLLSRMALSFAISDSSSAIKGAETAIDMKAAFNAKFGTSYTTAQLLTTYLKEFTAFFVSFYKTLSDMMTYPSIKYFAAPVKSVGGANHYLLRHTPKDRQKTIFYNPFWNDVKALVLPEVFNDGYLSPDNFNYETVDFWQSYTGKDEVNLKVTVPGWLESLITSGSTTTDTSYTANVAHVLAVIFDEDSVMTDFQLENARTSPVEARKGYRTIWYNFAKNAIIDPTERFICLYLPADPVTDAKDVTEEPKTSKKK